MKIAVISDIHGNIDALDAVLNDINDCGADKLLVLGDYAMAGPEPVETVEKFMKMQNDDKVEMIQGNTDLMIASFDNNMYEMLKTKAPVMAEALKNDAEIIPENMKLFLKSLPEKKEINIDGIKILMVHGSPRRNNEDILPDMPQEKIDEIIDGADADIILCGHTHLPCGYQTKNKISVVNAGSVGRPFTANPDSCYLLITINNGNYMFEHKFVKYDNKLASEKLAKRCFSGADKLSAMLLNPTVRHF